MCPWNLVIWTETNQMGKKRLAFFFWECYSFPYQFHSNNRRQQNKTFGDSVLTFFLCFYRLKLIFFFFLEIAQNGLYHFLLASRATFQTKISTDLEFQWIECNRLCEIQSRLENTEVKWVWAEKIVDDWTIRRFLKLNWTKMMNRYRNNTWHNRLKIVFVLCCCVHIHSFALRWSVIDAY